MRLFCNKICMFILVTGSQTSVYNVIRMFVFDLFYSLFIINASVVFISERAQTLCLFLADCAFMNKIGTSFLCPRGCNLQPPPLQLLIKFFGLLIFNEAIFSSYSHEELYEIESIFDFAHQELKLTIF